MNAFESKRFSIQSCFQQVQIQRVDPLVKRRDVDKRRHKEYLICTTARAICDGKQVSQLGATTTSVVSDEWAVDVPRQLFKRRQWSLFYICSPAEGGRL